jgi:CheY-like chemotaxis protein
MPRRTRRAADPTGRDAGIPQVHGTTKAREAVGLWRRLQPNLVLQDLHMPHLDGVRVLSTLREIVPARSNVLLGGASTPRPAAQRGPHRRAGDELR